MPPRLGVQPDGHLQNADGHGYINFTPLPNNIFKNKLNKKCWLAPLAHTGQMR